MSKINLKKILENPLEEGQNLSVEQLVKLLKKAADVYYNTGEIMMNDDTYDILKDILAKRDPNNKFLKEVGAPIKGKKVTLPFFMGSLDKIKDYEEEKLKKWSSSYKGPYHISDKVDGMSAMLYKDNEKYSLYSRGGGTDGKDITPILDHVKGFEHIRDIDIKEEKFAVRGELVITKADFKKHETKMANARNMVAGVVNRKDIDPKKLQDIRFIAYEVYYPKLKIEDQYKLLTKYQFILPHYEMIDKLNSKYLLDLLIKREEKAPYQIDGLVIRDGNVYENGEGNPKYAFAFKRNTGGVIVTIKNIKWNISKDGILVPVITFDPVKIEDVMVQNVTANNAKFIKDNMLNIGAQIRVVRSGGVIPHVVEIIKKTNTWGKPPYEYIWDENEVHAKLKEMKHRDRDIQELVYFFDKIGTENMGEGTISKLYDAGFQTIEEILNLTVDDLMEIEGFQKKLASKIIKNVNESIQNIPLDKLMGASNIMGRGIAEKKMKLVLEVYPNLLKMEEKGLENKLLEIKGMGEKTVELIMENLPKFKKWLHNITKNTNLTYVSKQTSQKKSNKLENLVVVFTGFRDKDLEKQITDLGGKVASGVTSKVTCLIVKSKGEKSSKIEKAEELEIEILTLDEFKNKYFLP